MLFAVGRVTVLFAWRVGALFRQVALAGKRKFLPLLWLILFDLFRSWQILSVFLSVDKEMLFATIGPKRRSKSTIELKWYQHRAKMEQLWSSGVANGTNKSTLI